MQKAMTLTYEVGNNLYLNITNQCPCNCVFCIRRNEDGAYDSDPLWLEHEPTLDEMMKDLKQREWNRYQEFVFCGYGEPTMRLDFMIALAKMMKSQKPDIILRLNTNGLADIYSGDKKSAEKTASVFDKVSISLNAGTAEEYLRVTNPKHYPENAFQTMQDFAVACKRAGVETNFTVVDVISPEEIGKAQKIADNLGIPMHIRKYIS